MDRGLVGIHKAFVHYVFQHGPKLLKITQEESTDMADPAFVLNTPFTHNGTAVGPGCVILFK